MLVFISGGVRSGKSTLGEKFADELAAGRKIYLATAAVYDDEMLERIAIHKNQRTGRGYITIEKSTDIQEIVNIIKSDDTILLDCLGNLLANEMFKDEKTESKINITEKIFKSLYAINEKAENLIIISNDVFSDGCTYSDSVIEYIDTLAKLHIKIAGISQRAIECVAGNSIYHKNCS